MRTRLTALAVVPLLVLAASCGSDDANGGNGSGEGGLDGVTITGDYGTAPEIEVKDLSVDKQTSVVLSRGDGPEAESDRQILIHLSLSKGSDGTSLASTWEVDQPLTIGPDAALIPELVGTLQDAIAGVPTSKIERLMNLVICLLSTRQFLTAEKIRESVAGYADSASDEAF
ncbi:MAG TPA: hypothetical protein VLI04_02840, partial [Nocardioidaceae bacterium]|nr:hypothetical protein [Nocardioidaceae bacterium]